ncbi:MAG: Wzz/FepE/Etk N-terminal domain-containing protein [Longimicrobiales bacterium]
MEDSARPAGYGPDEDEISLLQLFNVLLRHRGIIVTATALSAVAALFLAVLIKPSFTSTMSFIPQSAESGSSGLAGLAGQFGIQVPGGNSSESPQFYAKLVKSRKMLAALSEEEFRFEAPADGGGTETLSGTLSDILNPEGTDTAWPLRREASIQWLEGTISVSTARETGIVEVKVTTPWAGLSHQVAEQVLANVNEFNLETRQSRAAAERTFVSGQLAEAQDSLRLAENRLEAFLRENRQWASSPELAFQHDRLQRQVAMRQQLFTSLAQSHDAARIAEVRNTPVVTVVEAPELPVRRNPMGRIRKLALGLVLGGVLGVMLAFLREYSDRARKQEGEEYREFSTLWAQAWADVRSLGRLRRS